ncbi:MAG: VOC family protein [Cellvibrionaceae bacterium]|nr:VOC family protein [Cellvibrionaceae bacterium]
MYSHVILGSNNIEIAKKFYDAVFATMGYEAGAKDGDSRYIYFTPDGVFGITQPVDGKAATCGNGSTIGFSMPNPEAVDKWLKAGVENGGKIIEDAPGERSTAGMKLYVGYIRDPDGNKLCAVHIFPS